MIHYLTSVDCEDQFHAKVRGLFAIEELIADRPLDFCLITSSLSSVIGGMGFCDRSKCLHGLLRFVQKQAGVGPVGSASTGTAGVSIVLMRHKLSRRATRCCFLPPTGPMRSLGCSQQTALNV